MLPVTYNSNWEGLFQYTVVPQAWSIVGYFTTCVVLASILAVVPVILGPKKRAVDKNTAYECGFEPFIYSSEPVENHFIIVAILFVIFDLEVVMLVPYATSVTGDGYVGFLTVFGFGILLVLGLFYEWIRGALSWPVWCYYTNELPDRESTNK